MKRSIHAISLIAATLALASCATKSAEAIFTENQGLQQMESERLATVFDGNTIVWGDGSTVYYKGSEIRSPNSDGTVTIGTINFSNNLHCRTWNGGSEKCSSVYEGPDGKLSFFVAGKPDSSGGFGRITAGNPEGL